MEVVIEHKGEESPEVWAENHFRGARLGDPRRIQRAQKIGQAMGENTGKPIPELFVRKYDVDATYTFFDREEATPENIQAGHREHVRQAMSQPGKYLLPEDTTTMSYSHLEEIDGLGPVGPGKEHLQGFHLHSTLALRWPSRWRLREGEEAQRPPVEVLGVFHQTYFVRTPRPRGVKHDRSRSERPPEKQEFESEKWGKSIQEAGTPPADERIQWIKVCDREADIYEHIAQCQENRYGFVIRAGKDRKLEDPETGQCSGRLFDAVRAAKPVGHLHLTLRARPGQPARTATLAVSSIKLRMRAPQRPGHGPGFLPPMEVTAVRAWEIDPPQRVEPLEWILLTDQPAESFEEIVEVVLMYSTRWVAEEFHKALKTGCGAEKLQLEKGHRFFSAIAIMSLVALRLIHLREQFRLHPDAPAQQSGLDALEIQILEATLQRKIRTVRDVALAVGRLGGHMNRKSDGMPGWVTLWRGMNKLRLLKQGARLAMKSRFQV